MPVRAGHAAREHREDRHHTTPIRLDGGGPAEPQEGLRAAYRDVEWALDISQANFVDADFYYVPGELIRRDEETQFLLRRESFSGMDVSDLPSYAKIAVDRFEPSPWDSIVAIAPRRSRNFDRRLSELTELRRAGLAE